MKISGLKRALVLANVFNLLVAIYFIVISIVSLVQLRWYHKLTITIRVRHIITSSTSYFAFIIILFTAIVLIAIFIMSTNIFSSRVYIGPIQEASTVPNETREPQQQQDTTNQATREQQQPQKQPPLDQTLVKHRFEATQRFSPMKRLVLVDSTNRTIKTSTSGGICCSIFLHLITSVSLIVILIIWLLNTGELVRDSISTQLDSAYSRYQFSNRSNYYSIAIDSMQDVNNCCGSIEYTDFPHSRNTGLIGGHYPGSCCGKSTYAVNARVICTPEEIVRRRQTSGCVTVLANYYDLISLLLVPVSLACLFVNITIIALITISRGQSLNEELLNGQLVESTTGRINNQVNKWKIRDESVE